MKGTKGLGPRRGEDLVPDMHSWVVPSGAAGFQLAEEAARELRMSLDQAVDLIDFGSVQVNERQERNPRRRLDPGDRLRVFWPRGGVERRYEIRPELILYRDRTLLAYNKESSIPSQQTPSDAYNNLHAAVSRYLASEGNLKPYVALHHRLDRGTSGVMLFSLDPSVNRRLGMAFEQRRVRKEYLVWVAGRPQAEQWVCRQDIGREGGRYAVRPRGSGKPAETAFRVLLAWEDRALLLAQPLTGRTHQIRLHLAACGHPILGDLRYGAVEAPRLCLHAYRLALDHPVTGAPLVLRAGLPPDWPSPQAEPIPD